MDLKGKMTEAEAEQLVRRTYWLALGFAVVGFLAFFAAQGWRPATAFAFGGGASIANLWLFEKLTQSIEPASEGKARKNPWQAGIFILRYFLLLTFGYAIVKALGVNALAVILGLLSSTAAVLTSTILELLQSFFVSRSSH
jgi:hypothetical protein